MDKQHTLDITSFLSNVEKFTGHITVTETKEEYLEIVEDMLFKERYLAFTQLGVVVQTKYITHFLIEEAKKDTLIFKGKDISLS